jgi:transcriptional regulator with XRE-family HTH domain
MRLPDAQRIARVLAAARRAGGMPQAEVAQVAGLPVSSLSRLETGHPAAPRLTAELLGRLAEALDIYPEALLPKDPPYHGMAMLRGRMNTHFLYLGLWSRLAEIVELCVEEIRRFRPDIVGLSLLVFGDGDRGARPSVAYGATVGGLRIAPESLPWRSSRVRRGEELARAIHGGDAWNVLLPKEARIPGCDRARQVIEATCGAGVLWFALSHDDDPLADPELHPSERTGVPWHVGDVFTNGVNTLRGLNAPAAGRPTVEMLLERIQRIEASLQHSHVR